MPTFPSSPATNAEYTENGVTYVYTGSKWKKVVRPISAKGIQVTPVANTATIDLSLGNFFEVTYDTNISIVFTNLPDATSNQNFSVMLNAPAYPGFSLANASYDNKSSVVVATTTYGMSFKPDGTKMFVVDLTGVAIDAFSLTTPWDVSTASYTEQILVNGQDTVPTQVTFRPDGIAMYVVGDTNNTVYQYTLPVPWSFSGAFYASSAISVVSQEGNPSGISFKPDGTKMYISGTGTDTIYQYNLSTPWAVSTAVYENKFALLSAQDLGISGHAFNDSGDKVFVTGRTNSRVYQYNLSTPWDVSTITYSGISFSTASQETGPWGIYFKPEGDKMYISGNDADRVQQYSTTSTTRTVTWPSTISWQDGTAPTITPGTSCLVEFTTNNSETTSLFAMTPERDIK